MSAQDCLHPVRFTANLTFPPIVGLPAPWGPFFLWCFFIGSFIGLSRAALKPASSSVEGEQEHKEHSPDKGHHKTSIFHLATLAHLQEISTNVELGIKAVSFTDEESEPMLESKQLHY